jgi:hypothetical protein
VEAAESGLPIGSVITVNRGEICPGQLLTRKCFVIPCGVTGVSSAAQSDSLLIAAQTVGAVHSIDRQIGNRIETS